METSPGFTNEQRQALVQSMTCLLINKIKLLMLNAKKNRLLAEN